MAGRFDGGTYRDASGRDVVSSGDTTSVAVGTGGASGTFTLVAAQTRAIEVMSFHAIAKGATDFQWIFGVTAQGDPYGFIAGGGLVLNPGPGPHFICPTGSALKFSSSLAVLIGGFLTYRLGD